MLGIISITQTSEGNLRTVFEVDSQARFFDIDQTVNIDIATAFNANIGTCDVGDVDNDNDSIGLPNLDDEGVLEILCQSFIIYKIGLNDVREIRL